MSLRTKTADVLTPLQPHQQRVVTREEPQYAAVLDELAKTASSAGINYALRKLGLWDTVEAIRKEAAEYSEGPRSTFTHNKKKYSVDAAIAASKQRPVVEVPVTNLTWILKYSKPQEGRVRVADPTVPVLITKWGDKDVVVYGLHRLQAAQDSKQTTIPTRRLYAADLRKAQVKTISRV